MDSRKENHDRRLKKLEEHVTNAKKASTYSSDRFDILLISLSSTALVLSIGFVNRPEIHFFEKCLLKTSWLLFVITLISNLLSQVTGYYANYLDIKVTKNEIREERGKGIKGDQSQFQKRCTNLNRATLGLNMTSLLSLIIGVITLVIFFEKNI
jgi:hypothetical protein